MGAGHYSYATARMRSVSYSEVSREEIFVNRTMDSKMDPKNVVRECCETDEHPDTLPIIIGLDVTGSMGHVPEALIKKDFPALSGLLIQMNLTLLVLKEDLKTITTPIRFGKKALKTFAMH